MLSKFLRAITSVRHLPKAIISFMRNSLKGTLSFIFLLIVYLLVSLLTGLIMKKYLPFPWRFKNFIVQNLNSFYQRIVKMNHLNEDSINRTNLIELALYNMRFKKSRTFITVGGMAIGIAAIVYLVSIGYGLQELVISRVARLDEMKQVTISSPVGGQARLNDKTIGQISEFTNVVSVLPQIDAVGRVSYNNSVSDVVVYGVTSDYLNYSAIKPSTGKVFESNAQSKIITEPQVAGISEVNPVGFGRQISSVQFAFKPDTWIRVRDQPSTKGKIIGYTKLTQSYHTGVTVWGDDYVGAESAAQTDTKGQPLQPWIKGKVNLWQQQSCEPQAEHCVDGRYLALLDQYSQHTPTEGYMAILNIDTAISEDPNQPVPAVLGITTPEVLQSEDTSPQAKDDGSAAPDTPSASDEVDAEGFVTLESESGAKAEDVVKEVKLGDNAVKEVVVNRSALALLGIQESEAISRKVTLSFIIVGDLLENEEDKVQSVPAEYQIVGVIPDDRTPVMYVPFIDLKSLGVQNYSQVKLVGENTESLAQIRMQVEALGFTTQSVSDTVAQINSLFATVRTVLFLVGMAALSVASLGMFNTLTVSLLERTREVGLMKAMGMRSSEVHELFLTESMIMGLFGGLMGIFLGVAAGQFTSVALSAYAISRGVGFLNISYTPPVFILVILGLALTVGLVTGLYPARHATRISALNALRYE